MKTPPDRAFLIRALQAIIGASWMQAQEKRGWVWGQILQETAGAAGNATGARQVGYYCRGCQSTPRPTHIGSDASGVFLPGQTIGRAGRCGCHDGSSGRAFPMNQLDGDQVSFRALFFRRGHRCRGRFPARVHCRRRLRDPGQDRRPCLRLFSGGQSGTWLCMKRPRQRDGNRSARLAPGIDWDFLPRQAGLLRQTTRKGRLRLP